MCVDQFDAHIFKLPFEVSSAWDATVMRLGALLLGSHHVGHLNKKKCNCAGIHDHHSNSIT